MSETADQSKGHIPMTTPGHVLNIYILRRLRLTVCAAALMLVGSLVRSMAVCVVASLMLSILYLQIALFLEKGDKRRAQEREQS